MDSELNKALNSHSSGTKEPSVIGPTPTPPPPPPAPANQFADIKPLRTYEGDVAGYFKTHDASMAKIAIAEQTRRKRKPEPELKPRREARPKKALALVLFSIFFVVAGGFAIYFIVSAIKARPVIIGTETVKTLVPTEAQKEINLDLLDQSKLKNQLVAEIANTQLQLGSALGFYFTKTSALGKQLATANDFLSQIAPNAPNSLTRILKNDFLFGIVAFDGNQPFLILRHSSFQQAFAGMLEWEKNLPFDLEEIFVSTKDIAIGDSNPLVFIGSNFSDEIINNKDTRVLKGEDGKTQLIYSLLDNSTLLITRSKGAFGKILERLSSSKLIR